MQHDITQLVASQISSGKMQKALEMMTSYIENNPATDNHYTILAIIYQRLSNIEKQIESAKIALNKNPKNIKANFLLADGLTRQSKFIDALKAYQKGMGFAVKTTPQSSNLRQDMHYVQTLIPELMSKIEQEVRGELSRENLDSQSDRFSESLDIMFGHKKPYMQEPKQFYFPGLAQKPIFDTSEFSFIEHLRTDFDSIKTEALSILKDPTHFSPYLESRDDVSNNEHIEMLDNPNWSAFYLIKDGVKIEDNIRKCPKTMAALSHAPLCDIQTRSPSILFSWLKPGAHIPPHTGMLNTRLICHFPIIIPKSCSIRVGNVTHNWVAGETFIFDDTIEHEAWNKSTEDRLVLIFDIWRPDITQAEINAVRKLIEIGV